MLQLRNELYRQRRIRLLNERTFASTRDRSHKVEALVAEMRMDLKSLKLRLEEELHELGKFILNKLPCLSLNDISSLLFRKQELMRIQQRIFWRRSIASKSRMVERKALPRH